MLSLRIAQRVEPHFFVFESNLLCFQHKCIGMPHAFLTTGSPYFLYPQSLPFVFRSRLPFSVPVDQESRQPGAVPALRIPLAWPRRWALARALHFPVRSPHCEGEAELRMPPFASTQRPFFLSQVCCISSISLLPPLRQF